MLHHETLQQHLIKAYNDQRYIDLTLICEGTAFPVHRVVVTAYSTLLHTVCDSPLCEPTEGRLSVSLETFNINQMALTVLLEYMYTGTLQWTEGTLNLEDLLKAAEILEMQLDTKPAELTEQVEMAIDTSGVKTEMGLEDTTIAIVEDENLMQSFNDGQVFVQHIEMDAGEDEVEAIVENQEVINPEPAQILLKHPFQSFLETNIKSEQESEPISQAVMETEEMHPSDEAQEAVEYAIVEQEEGDTMMVIPAEQQGEGSFIAFVANEGEVVGEVKQVGENDADDALKEYVESLIEEPIMILPKIERQPRTRGTYKKRVKLEVRDDAAVVVSSNSAHSCGTCGKHCEDAAGLKRHMATHNEGGLFFSCPNCDHGFETRQKLTRHMISQHPEPPARMRTRSRGATKVEEITAGSPVDEEQSQDDVAETKEGISELGNEPEASLDCPKCPQIFRCRQELQSHMNMHENLRPFQCAECQRGFFSRKLCYEHVQKSHRIQKPRMNKEIVLVKDIMEVSRKVVDELHTYLPPPNKKAKVSIDKAEGKYLCPKCPETFRYLVRLSEHMNVHQGINPYQCKECEERFPTQKLCHQHIKTEHNQKEIIMHRDILLLVDSLNSEQEESKEAGTEMAKIFQCKTCSESFNSKFQLAEHKVKAHSKMQHKCHVCGKVFSFKKMLLDHMNYHLDNRPYPCTACDKAFYTKKDQTDHRRRLHPNVEFPKDQLNIKPAELCHRCGRSFSSRARLSDHYNVHLGKTPYECSKCSKSFSARHLLTSHHTRVHRRPPRKSFQCETCLKNYSSRRYLLDHKKFVHQKQGIPCTHCALLIPDHRQLAIHMRTHTGHRPFSCRHCDRKFGQAGARKRHEAAVHGLKINIVNSVADEDAEAAIHVLATSDDPVLQEEIQMIPCEDNEIQTIVVYTDA